MKIKRIFGVLIGGMLIRVLAQSARGMMATGTGGL